MRSIVYKANNAVTFVGCDKTSTDEYHIIPVWPIIVVEFALSSLDAKCDSKLRCYDWSSTPPLKINSMLLHARACSRSLFRFSVAPKTPWLYLIILTGSYMMAMMLAAVSIVG
jgi:hypothetical protein